MTLFHDLASKVHGIVSSHSIGDTFIDDSFRAITVQNILLDIIDCNTVVCKNTLADYLIVNITSKAVILIHDNNIKFMGFAIIQHILEALAVCIGACRFLVYIFINEDITVGIDELLAIANLLLSGNFPLITRAIPSINNTSHRTVRSLILFSH